nr:putative ribonuclease H-like domain-containing protein [Tanacetum cinerariifolium]
EIVTHGFTLIVLSALRRSDNENTLSLTILILRSILTDLQETLKRRWRYLIPAESQIHNHMLKPDYQDIKFQDFHYSDRFECYQVIKIGRVESAYSLIYKQSFYHCYFGFIQEDTTKEEFVIQKEEMELESTQSSTTAKLPLLKQENGNSFKPVAEITTDDAGTSTTIISGHVTIEEKAKKKNDVKARSMLLMALPNEHLMTFNKYKDAKTLFAAIETRFSGNEATKKTLLKQMYKNEDLNLMFLRSLPSKWNTHVVVWRNKSDLDTMSLDDLYKNFKFVEQEVRGTTSTNTNSKNMDFVSSPSPNSTSDATVYAFLANQPNRSQLVHEDLEQIHKDDLEETNLMWQLALLSMKAKRFFQKTDTKRRTVNVEDTSSKAMVEIDGAGFDWSYMADDEAPTNMAFMAFSDLESGFGYVSYNVVPPLHTERFSPLRIDLSHTRLPEFAEPSVKSYGVTPIEVVTQTSSVKISAPVKENFGAPLIEEWESDEEDEVKSPPEKERKNVEPSVNKVEVEIPKQNDKPTRRPDRCKYHQRKRMVNGTNHSRVNHNATTVPKAMLTRTGLKLVNSVRPVNPKRNFFKKINTTNEKVNTARPNSEVLNAVKANKGKAVKAYACWVWRPIKLDNASIVLKKHTYIDVRGRSKSEFERGYVAFRGGAKGGKITSKVTIKTGKLDFEDVYFVKDETSRILKSFITNIENLVDKKVKVIRCDNGTKFKNRVMNEFCVEKGIKREYSIARTPQQNKVAERRNRTLIEATRKMLADSKLPITFLGKAVNTACYVQNRILVVKPHFKTPYELFRGRTHAFSFMRPFGCHVTILNTLDHLGKFNDKSDEGFFVGYSTNRKGASFNAGQSSMEEGPSQDYILMPLWNDSSLFNSSLKDSDGENWDTYGLSTKSKIDNQERLNDENSTKDINTIGPSINTASSNINTASLTVNTVRLSDDYFGANNDMRSLHEVELDISNLSITYLVPTTPNTRISKDHSLDNVIGDMQSGVQTKRMTVTTDEHGFISAIYEEKGHVDLHTCLFACFLSQEEPKRITNALKDLAWVEAMQEKLLRFHLQKVWTLVDLPRGKKSIVKNRGKIDQTLFIKRQKEDILLVQVYINDIISGSTKKELCTEFKVYDWVFDVSYII